MPCTVGSRRKCTVDNRQTCTVHNRRKYTVDKRQTCVLGASRSVSLCVLVILEQTIATTTLDVDTCGILRADSLVEARSV